MKSTENYKPKENLQRDDQDQLNTDLKKVNSSKYKFDRRTNLLKKATG